MKKSVFFLSILLIIYFLTAVFNFADWDLWARLAVGKIFFETGIVLKHDIFAYTPTKEIWVDHEWLSGVIFYWFSHKFGDVGLSLLKFLLMLAVFIPVYKLNRIKFPEQNHYRIFYYTFFLCSLVILFANTVRAQCFTCAFFALWMYVLELVKNGNNRLLWIFPLTMILWANLHGGFVSGLGLLVLYGIGEALNKRSFSKYFITAGISSLVTLINPYGINYWTYLSEALSMRRTFITEWQPIDLFNTAGTAFGFKILAVIAVISFIYAFIKNIKQINWAEILIISVTFWLSLNHMRHSLFFMIAAVGYSTGYFYNLLENIMPVPKFQFITIVERIKEFIIYSLIIIFGILTIWFVPLKVKVTQERFPVKAVKFIDQNNLSGNLLVLFNWGSYALWKLYPQCKIAVDGRYEEVYSEDFINEVARFHYLGKGWMDLLNKYHTDIILINKDYEVYKNLLLLDNWKVVYTDEVSAVFLPASINNSNWTLTGKEFNIDSEKFKSNIKMDMYNKKRVLN